MEDEDVRYSWAAYKKGCLKDMAGPLAEDGLSAEQFKAAFETVVIQRYNGAWTLFAETPRGFLPVGMVFAYYSHPVASPFMIISDIVWMPWATGRNKIESAVNFFNATRNEIPMVYYAYGDSNKRFFEMLARHGIMRRIGITFNVMRGEPVHVFETIARA